MKENNRQPYKMENQNRDQEQAQRHFYELAAHNRLQVFIFFILVIIAATITFLSLLPAIRFTVEEFLNGYVTTDGTERTAMIYDEPDHSIIHQYDLWKEDMEHMKENKKDILLLETNYFTNWAVDLNVGTPNAVRFWINPLISFFVPSLIIGALIASYITVIFPISVGLVRRRIEREIVYNLDKICYKLHSYYSEEKNAEIERMILEADIHDLHIFKRDWGLAIDELRIIYAALKWRNSGLVYRMIHPLKGLNIYLRLYFTEKYSNAILGLVYIGAAILIIIIGLRGLKFIPATQPSPILFSLGVEFTLLFTYAFTLIFTKPEPIDSQYDVSNHEADKKSLIRSSDNSRDIENVLRAFLKKK